MVKPEFWNRRSVFVTGNTGFKGTWLSIWLHKMGANVTGYALEPVKNELNLFQECKLDKYIHSIYGDIRDYAKLKRAIEETSPEIIIHMAAQPLVRESYQNPVETYCINVMGTVHVLEAVREINKNERKILGVLNITTDKCYENREWVWGYRENEALGGYDPYSSSKACSELVTSSYRSSFFQQDSYSEHGAAIASARAGNVIGGGDWAKDRLIPDCVRAIMNGQNLELRYPEAIRPWQHVLEPLHGYMQLVERLVDGGQEYAEAWNFGPGEDDMRTVEWMARHFCEAWGDDASYRILKKRPTLHENTLLRLDCSKAMSRLGWRPRWNADQAIIKVVEWTKLYLQREEPLEICLRQIDQYLSQ
ncbi:CDP-glucose 4,6-dehydratase [Paenibacillus puerhi]|uniref:CDP-glucose 4,6-dehydratase n=1 Tax=Paenibacillus puerhi TaxID=2692622 RepID=UPI00135998CA|nr:CDP-glucose 4,6-dehydratase [Paenibacillus puerhi]